MRTVSVLCLDTELAEVAGVNHVMVGAVPPGDQLTTIARHHRQTALSAAKRWLQLLEGLLG